jgi:trypsin
MEGNELDLAPRIINGDAATPNRYPYTASLISSSRHVCGGTLIAPDVILTAGHCSGFFSQVQIDRYDITVDDGGYDYLMVEKHLAHPNFANIIQSDFALAKLYGRSWKRVVTLNTDGDVPQDDEYLTVMGWGVTVEGVSSTQSNVLREVDVQSMGNMECDASSGQYKGSFVTYEGYIEDNMLCAWSQDKDACQGDSGGPLIRKGDDAGQDVQVGVVSWGLGCAMETFPGVYSRTSAEYEWIRSSVCEISKFPPTSFGCDAPAKVSGQKETVTLVVELDGSADDTSWVLEADDRGDFVQGTSYAPFGTYDSDNSVAVEALAVSPGQSYRFTVMDRNGGGSARSSSRFRICYGSMSASQCLSDDDAVICGATGILSSARSVKCTVEAKTPSPAGGPSSVPGPAPGNDGRLPTFSPFFVPLFFETRQQLVSFTFSYLELLPISLNDNILKPSFLLSTLDL